MSSHYGYPKPTCASKRRSPCLSWPQVGAGEVRRPGLYELAQGETLADLIEYWGFHGQADVRFIRLSGSARTVSGRCETRALPDRDVLICGEVTIALQDGDLVFIPSPTRTPAGLGRRSAAGRPRVAPGRYQWEEGMTVRQLLAVRGA